MNKTARGAPCLASILMTLAALASGGCSGTGTTSSASSTHLGIAIILEPSVAPTTPGSKIGFSATVAGASDARVTWSVLGADGADAGSIDGAGLYTAPAADGTYTVVATSVADPSKIGVATVYVAEPTSTDVTGLIPADRVTPWNPGLNAVNGLPPRSTVCATVQPGGGDDTAAIQAAVNACPDNQVVQLVAGTYHMTQNGLAVRMRSNVTVRGAVDANGRPASRILLPLSRSGQAFAFGDTGEDENFLQQPVNLTNDAPRGSISVTVASDPGYVVGELVTIDQLTADPIWLNPDHFNSPAYSNNPSGPPINRNMFVRSNRMIGQTLEIAAVHGNIVTFTAPLHADYTLANQAQLVRHGQDQTGSHIVTSPVKFAGVENVYIEGGHFGGHIGFFGAAYCWAKNIESRSWLTADVSFVHSFRCELRDSYIHQTQEPNPGGGGYAIDLCWHASDNLVENNIVWAANKVIVARASGGGNVVGYNYFEDGFMAGFPTIPEAGANASHYAGPHMELFEGNQSWNLYGDNVWGNSVWITFFRNNATGLRRNVNGTPYWDTSGALHASNNFQQDAGGRVMVGIGATHDYYNFVGNVLGYPGMPAPPTPWVYESTGTAKTTPCIWQVGFSQAGDVDATAAQADATRARTLRHGNWDYGVNNGVVWDPTIARHDLPPSLYRTSPPLSFGNMTWPWVDPLTGTLATLPARARFDAMLAAGTL